MDYAPNPIELIKLQWRVIVALMLRDIKTRFGNEFGFILAIAWPLSHILILLLINTAMGRIAPYGDSAALWFATGIVPFMSFSYTARFIMLGIVLNRPLLVFPRVKITDILFSRALVEVLNAGAVILVLILIFWFLGIDFMPIDIVQACSALVASILLGLGVGVINGIIAAALPMWITGYALLNIILWISSGVFFVADSLPEIIRVPLSFHPVLQAIEWMRSAYYEGYGANVLDRRYLISFALVCLCFGLLSERLVRGKLLQ
jgi:capsular polysaccharide transport system permease protein